MYWDKLPPRQVEECRHRRVAEPGSAACNLLAQVGLPRDRCDVHRDVCSACVQQFPPDLDCWNTVVASLIYVRTTRALESGPLAPEERANLLQLKDRASSHLAVWDGGGSPGEAAPDGGRPVCSLREVLPPPPPRSKRRVRTWAAGVVSSPRRQPTLDATLDSLIRAGWDAPCLFLDGTVRVPERFARLPGVLREPRVGCWPNYYLALAELLMRRPDVDAYLLVQDDVRFYDVESIREYLEAMLWPDERPCLVSLYCPSPYSAGEFGWRPRGSAWGLGALAFVFPRRLAQAFLLDPTVCNHRWGRWQEKDGGLVNVDIVIGSWAWREQIPIWYPTPSLVQHVGATSTLGPTRQATGNRRANCWVGSLVSPDRG